MLDTRFEGLDAVVRNFERIIAMKSHPSFNTVEHHSSTFHRLFGGGEDLSLTFQYIDKTPDFSQFSSALNSPITNLIHPDMADRVKHARSYILLEVTHGKMTHGGITHGPINAMEYGPALAGTGHKSNASDHNHPAAAFEKRLETLATMARIACDTITPNAVHWGQSNQLFDPETFEISASSGFPGPLTIHPMLFGGELIENNNEISSQILGLKTFGASHWLGHEIVVPATSLPWTAAYQTVLDFCIMSAPSQASAFADGDTFGPEDGSEIWRIHRRGPKPANDEENADGTLPSIATPIIELIPLRHDECKFVSEEYARQANVTMIRKPRASNSSANPNHDASTKSSSLVELEDALSEGLAQAAENPPAPLQNAIPSTGRPSQSGGPSVSGRGLRAQLFGKKAD